MTRADWTDFRHIDGLVARGGISARELRRLVAKELLDNAADEADTAKIDAAPSSLTTSAVALTAGRKPLPASSPSGATASQPNMRAGQRAGCWGMGCAW